MKKLTILFTILLFPFSFFLSAQEWVNLMHDKNANVHDVQKAFYAWYGSNESSKAIPEHESGYELFKRWENIMVPRTYPTGNRNNMAKLTNDYTTYKNNNLRNAHKMSSATANWSYVGTQGVPTHGGDGRVNRIRFYPGKPNILYACAPGGGLWKSTNGGTSWATNTDQLTSIATSDIAINPNNPAIMYLATGDGDGYDAFTTGVLKSTDTGKTWNPTSLGYTLQQSGASDYEANQLLINPDSSNVVFAAMNFGLYRSRDTGKTWAAVIANNIRDIEFEPFHSNVVYASSEYGSFYRSTDAGLTFTAISSGLPNTDVARVTIGVSPADSNRVYLLVDENSTSRFYGLYMSTDRGQTFATQASFAGGAPNLLGWSPSGNDSSGQGWYTLPLAVSPTNADTIVVGGVNIWMSGDQGVTWHLNAEWTGSGAPYVHADIHHIIFYPGSGSSYIAGCDGGIFETSNKGGTWKDISNNLEIGELYTIGLSALTPGLNISGWQDNGTNVSGLPWAQTYGGDGETAFIDYTNDADLYASTQNGNLINSQDGGANWNNAVGNITESGAWTTPWIQDPYLPDNPLIFAGYENLWTSLTNVFTWNPVSTWGVKGKYINCISIYPGNDNYIYVSRGDSLFATTDFANTWSVIDNGLPIHAINSTSITVDPNDSVRIWATFSGFNATDKVYQSEDAGHTWKNISAGLPNLPVNCLVCQANTPEGIYVGTDIGVYYHDTILNSWISYNNGLPNVMVNDLKIEGTGTLVAATYGRGVWQTSTVINTAVNNIVTRINADVYPNPTTGKINLIMNGATPGNYTIAAINILGQMIYSDKVSITGDYTKTLDFSTYGKGVYFLRIEGNNAQTVKKVVVL